MTLASGTPLGPYEIIGAIGAGGMGEVYRARDTKLDRDVAIKVLPEALAADPERIARFQREAKTLASLNHPHIAAIYGIEESGGTHALVMELVEGDDLSQRIARGPIPLDEALPIAKQIAEALEAAHEQGIIHRDLKPANIKVRPDGAVKVLDFGLAKLAESSAATAGGPSPLSMSPTITSPAMMTGVGVLLGTAAYMSPEQAKGRPADKRSDIWAFGCVLYEMLAGKRPFEGEDVTDVLVAVLSREPDWNALPVNTPTPFRKLLRRCLDKDRRRRLADIADARFEIDDVKDAPDIGSGLTQDRSRIRERIAWASALTFVTVTAVGAMVWMRSGASSEPPPERRLEIVTPQTFDPTSFAISPDGRRLVFAASEEGVQRLWLRSLDAVSAQPMMGTEGAAYSFWSPDSRSVAFFADGKLRRLDIGTGASQTIANALPGRGGSWSEDGVILFAPGSTGVLFRVSASGGEVVAVTKLAPGQISHRFPEFLPGGRRFLFYASGTADTSGIYVGSLDAPDAKRLTAADTAGAYAPPGWLLFPVEGTLIARRFDAIRGELTGDPVSVADMVDVDPTYGIGAFSTSGALVAYRASGSAATHQLTWFDRSGKVLGTLAPPDGNVLLGPRLSPDGRRVASYRTVLRNTDLWLFDPARSTRFTFDPNRDFYPVWSPDGKQLVFSSYRKGPLDLYQKSSSGAVDEEALLSSSSNKAPQDFSSDGRFLLYSDTTSETGQDLWVLPMGGNGERKPVVFLKTRFNERHARFSPDGRWVAYHSDESGRYEIYVRPFSGSTSTSGSGGEWQVSTAGGIDAIWRRDGKELYYIAPDGKLMATPIVVNGATLEPGLPTALFQTRIVYGGSSPVGITSQYDVAPDGRFLINVSTEGASAAPITLILDWAPALKK